jgi:hypothetical protein
VRYFPIVRLPTREDTRYPFSALPVIAYHADGKAKLNEKL